MDFIPAQSQTDFLAKVPKECSNQFLDTFLWTPLLVTSLALTNTGNCCSNKKKRLYAIEFKFYFRPTRGSIAIKKEE